MHRILILSISIFLVLSSNANACSCASAPDIANAFKSVDVIFSGEVVEIEDLRKIEGPESYGYQVRFLILEEFKGVSGEEFTVQTGYGGGDCGYRFEVGEEHLVFADKVKEVYLTGICTGRIRPLDFASNEVDALRKLNESLIIEKREATMILKDGEGEEEKKIGDGAGEGTTEE